MKRTLLIAFCTILAIGLSTANASDHKAADVEKPGMIQAVVTKFEATVEAVDHDNRKVTLKGPEGKTITIDVQEDVKNLPQVEVGDLVTIEYIEAVSIQVFAEGEVEAGATAVAATASAEAGQKPSGVQVEEVTVVATIEAIDKEQELVTLKGAEGRTKTVKPNNPENLEKVVVGDKVMITYTGILGIEVTEK